MKREEFSAAMSAFALAVVLCGGFAAAPAAHADEVEYVWTGEAGDNMWNTAGNWSVGGEAATSFPDSKSTQVRFTGSADVLLPASYWISRLSVESGEVSFSRSPSQNGKGLKFGNANTATGEFFVASGARARCACDVGGESIVKTGGGVWSNEVAYFGYYVGIPKVVYVKEGKWENKSYLYAPQIVVAPGAEFATSGGYPSTVSNTNNISHVHVEKGGTLRGGPGNSYPSIDGVTGEGSVYAALSFRLYRGPYRFNGTASGTWYPGGGGEETSRIIVGTPTGFKDLIIRRNSGTGEFMRYASDQGGEFEIGGFDMRDWRAGTLISSENEDGCGVTVSIGRLDYYDSTKNVQFCGKGTFMLPGNSMRFSTTNWFHRLTGFVGTKPGGGITIGDGKAYEYSTNLLAAAGLVVSTNSSVYYDTPGIVHRGSVVGGGNVKLRSDATLCNLNLRNGAIALDNASLRIMEGLSSLTKIGVNATYTKRYLDVCGGVVAGPLAVDTNLAEVVATVLPRPVQSVPLYDPDAYSYYIPSAVIRMPSGNGEIHLQPYSSSTSVSFAALTNGTVYVHGGAMKGLNTTVCGTRIAMCPTNGAAFYPATGTVTIGEGGAEFISGLSAGGAAMDYRLKKVAGTGTLARYGAGTFQIEEDPVDFSGDVRILDGCLVIDIDKTLVSLLGSGGVEIGSAKVERGSYRELLLNAATISGGALVVPGRDGVTFTSLAFARGGALFLARDGHYSYLAEPSGAPIFEYDGETGAVAPTARCSADHVALDGSPVSEPLSFSSHGILAVGASTTVSGALSGQSGVGIVAPADGTKRVVALSGSNSVSGGTYINGVEVVPESAQAFGDGPVFVGAGEWMGGRIRFTRPLSFGNAFTAGGWGPVDERGALVFEASTTLGSLAVSRPLRMRIASGVTATVASAVHSDECIQIAGNGGTLVLAGGKSGSGRLDVIRSKVRLTGAEPALGTGQIWLDNGTIEFANTSPIVVSNLVYGVGRIVCSGADVAFASPSLDFDGILHVPGSAHVSFHTQSKLGEKLQVWFARLQDKGASVDLGGVYRKVDRVVGFGEIRDTVARRREWKPSGLMIFVR